MSFRTLRAAVLLGTTALAPAILSAPAMAQITTSAIIGTVESDTGTPISGAQVTITNASTGLARQAVTDGGGSFVIRNLPVSGAYTATVTAGGYQGERVDGIELTLGDEARLNFALGTGALDDEIIVVAQRLVVDELAIGPSASFGEAILDNAPAINRNIADIIRLDPRVFVDESRGDINSVQCVGQSSRFNSITLDGVALNDSFGLNSNGYPTERMPFPFAALEQVSVEIAPFDVQYGGFTACNINSVTKSGGNELSGGAFIDYTNDNLRADTVDGIDTNFADFDEIRYGADIGFPIIKDKLFGYVAYEKLEGVNTYSLQAVGDGDFQVTQAQIDEIAQISRDIYQYDPGFIPSSFDNEDEKILVKLDWNITDNHRASFTFDYNDGFNIVRSDGDSNELEFSNHLYERGAELQSYVGAVYSDWTDNFSTELRVGYLELDNRQESIGGNDFGEIRVEVGNVDVYLGGDDSRQANDLDYDLLDLSLRANYDIGNHRISAGVERKDLDIFNLFIQQAETEIRFRSIDDFRNGIASQVEYNNAPSQNPIDAAADWGYALNTAYIQDEFTLLDDITVVAGVRYDWYTSDDLPTENPEFVADYGFTNAQNLDGEGLFQPRIGMTWDVSPMVQLRGGVGLYSGGNPNVWLSNNYSANNIDQVGARIRGAIDLFGLDYTLAEDGVPNGPGYAVPVELADSVATGVGRNFEINYLDPDFEVPSEWKYALGVTFMPEFTGGNFVTDARWQLTGDLLWSDAQDTAIILRGDLVQDGTQVINGVTYPTYDSPLVDSFVLTNADVSNRSFSGSLGLSGEWDNGLGMTLGYAYTDAKDVQPMTSSVAFSNYNNRAFIDPQEQVLSQSNYNIEHRVTGSLSYRKAFIGDYETGLFAFFQSSSGRPFSRTQDGVANDIYGFTPFLGNGGDSILLPGTVRNQFKGDSWTKLDLRVSQDLPGFREDDRASVFMVIDNFTNLLDSDWGVLRQPGFPRTLTPGQGQALQVDASAYEIRFGADYTF